MKTFAGQRSCFAAQPVAATLSSNVKRSLGRQTNSSGMNPETQKQGWFTGVWEWLRLQKLKHELRASRSFQKLCEQSGCPTLVELEKEYAATLVQRIREKQEGKTSSTPQILKLQTKTQTT